MERSIFGTWRGLDFCGAGGFGCAVAVALGLLSQAARADELIQPPVCSFSPLKPIPEYCEIKTLDGKTLDGKVRREIKVNLTAKTAPIEVGGYTVTTENYNGAYLSPVVEALPGDTVAAHLENLLEPRATPVHTMAEGAPGENPTSLHYFHGGIVTPHNSRPPIDAGQGNGDNVYVRLKNQKAGEPYRFDFNVPIPGEGMLDARVLEGKGTIAHPYGLDWYHSHMHGISSDQVMGGLSGLLSVGEDNGNVKAKCLLGEPPDKCIDDTAELKKRTIVRYALLRDISLKNITALPGDPSESKTAVWAPEQRDFPAGETCGVWKTPNSQPDFDPILREGFCQRDVNSAWLFTLNGQRFPTITVEAGKNLLLRLGNLSANVSYWLELYNERTQETFPLTILSLDGVVPTFPVDPTHPGIPVEAFNVKDLLLMSASRAEIYVRNDDKERTEEQVYVLRTTGFNSPAFDYDRWPEIQLARIVLKPSVPISGIALALNAPTEKPSKLAGGRRLRAERLPDGCVRDLDPAKGEHRRVQFLEGEERHWKITTDIVHPPEGSGLHLERQFIPDPTATVAHPFEDYVQADHSFDWDGTGVNHAKHVCIHLDHIGSHKQLWVLFNNTAEQHNFHIHQIKFRLATTQNLEEHHIDPLRTPSHTCPDAPASCDHPDYKFYEYDPNPKAVWHDTMPMPAGGRVFVIMSFDAAQQIGRFVYHCHILKHEDKGLMAPIEVWGAP